ncbi:uncharacterized protein LOC132552627 [Ylistrum balloti]|uniref:uncharacterized protein LOC132552627 n=1 Tax=Ylistrum balloti TaxID=509963 RepID=UPI002905ABB9|nr:uncharacterized protein LOC132552627 [Ylistrum balloti]
MAATSGTPLETVRCKGSSKCPNHKQKDVVYVCLDCKILMCTTCGIKSSHKTHNLEELDVYAPEKKSAMLEFINKSENNTLPQLREDTVSTEVQETKVSSELKEVTNNTKQHEKKCKHIIGVLISDITSQCEEIVRINLEKLRQHKEDTQHRYDVISAEVKECKKVLQTGTDVDVYDTEFDTIGNDRGPDKPVLQTCQYQPCTNVTYHLQQAIGKFTVGSITTPINAQLNTSSVGNAGSGKTSDDGKSSTHHSPYKLLDQSAIVSQFSFATKAISICATRKGEIWVLESECKTLTLLNSKGEIKRKIKLEGHVQDMCVCPTTGNLWFCNRKQTIYLMHNQETPVKQFTVSDSPTCLCVTGNRIVVLATTDKLVACTVTGSVVCTTMNEKKTSLLPYMLSWCPVTGNVAVAYCEHVKAADQRRLCVNVYDKSLKQMFTYIAGGLQQNTCLKMFIVYDSVGNLVINDQNRNIIELISGSGQFIKTLHNTVGGAISIDPNNVLFIQVCQEVKEGKRNTTFQQIKYYE